MTTSLRTYPPRMESFSEKEREWICQALRQLWNDLPVRNIRQRAAVEKLLDEFERSFE